MNPQEFDRLRWTRSVDTRRKGFVGGTRIAISETRIAISETRITISETRIAIRGTEVGQKISSSWESEPRRMAMG
jgi:hypothetical protein